MDRMAAAQRIIDRCGGDVAKAMTYAAFRYAVVGAIREHWPTMLGLDPDWRERIEVAKREHGAAS